MIKLLSVTGCLAGTLWLCTASAGVRSSFPLTLSGNTASGALGTVRNDGSPVNGITCTLWGCPSNTVCNGYSLPATVTAECQAGTAARTLDCRSTNPNLIAAVQAMSPDSFVTFTTDSTGATCTKITVGNGSIYEVPSTYP